MAANLTAEFERIGNDVLTRMQKRDLTDEDVALGIRFDRAAEQATGSTEDGTYQRSFMDAWNRGR